MVTRAMEDGEETHEMETLEMAGVERSDETRLELV